MQDGGQDGQLHHDKGKMASDKNVSKCIFEQRHEKSNNVIFEHFKHKMSYTKAEDE